MAVLLVYVAAVFGLFAVLAFVEEWLTRRERGL